MYDYLKKNKSELAKKKKKGKKKSLTETKQRIMDDRNNQEITQVKDITDLHFNFNLSFGAQVSFKIL